MEIYLTIERLSKILGFHNFSSFVITLVFLVVALALMSALVWAIVKKRKENLKEINKIVESVQAKEPEKPEGARSKAVDRKVSLTQALEGTRLGFVAKLNNFFNENSLRDEDLEELEAILFTADIGPKTVQKLFDKLKEKAKEGKEPQDILKEEMKKILSDYSLVSNSKEAISPKVIMFVGVNGAGKTTSIGKLGAKLVSDNKKVLFGAGDTFRAAAVKQLSLWGEKIGADVISGAEGADSASVLYEAIKKGSEQKADVVLCDTAGRLHTKHDLMDELKKVYKVLGKAKEGAPDEVFLVVDATMGQNAIMQAREFAQATPITGMIVSKLDGTAKGGVLLGIVDELKVPIRYIGIGEKPEDLREFNADEFVDALFE